MSQAMHTRLPEETSTEFCDVGRGHLGPGRPGDGIAAGTRGRNLAALRHLTTSDSGAGVVGCQTGTGAVSLGRFMWALLKEFLAFARREKKWWLIPLVVLLLGVGAVLIFTSSGGIVWALYPFM